MTTADQWRALIKEIEDPKDLYDLAFQLVGELEKALPSEASRSKLMELCQDQGELTTGRRVDEVVQAFAGLKKRAYELEKEAADCRVEVGRLNVRCPDFVVDDSLVPDWVREEVGKTRWDIIARMDRGRALIGVSYHFVHSRSMSDFKDRDHCWRDVLSSAFYTVDEGTVEPVGEKAGELKAQIDRMVDMGVKAADERIQEMEAKQQAMCQQAFEDGKKAATERCAQYAEGLADSGQVWDMPGATALKMVAGDFRRGEHEKVVSGAETATPTKLKLM